MILNIFIQGGIQMHKLKRKTNDIQGITLIALVVTIVVLLILAAVSVQMLTGENRNN